MGLKLPTCATALCTNPAALITQTYPCETCTQPFEIELPLHLCADCLTRDLLADIDFDPEPSKK